MNSVLISSFNENLQTGSIAIYTKQPTSPRPKKEAKLKAMSKLTEKIYTVRDARRRNASLSKIRQSTISGYDSFLTCILPFGSCLNNKIDFVRKSQSFFRWFSSKYSKGYIDYCYDLDEKGNIHLHANVNLGMNSNLNDFQKCTLKKWNSLIHSNLQKNCKVTEFHQRQLQYHSKKSKLILTVKLISIFKGKKTYGTINLKNKTTAKSKSKEISEKSKQMIQEYFIYKLEADAIFTKSKVNFRQYSNVRNGNFVFFNLSKTDFDKIIFLTNCYMFDRVKFSSTSDMDYDLLSLAA